MKLITSLIDEILANDQPIFSKNEMGYQQCYIPAQRMILETDNLFIYGKVGVGKTYQMLRLAKRFYQVKYVKWSILVELNLKAITGQKLDNAEYNSLNYTHSDLLILDDFLTTNLTQTQMELLFKIVDWRLEHKKPIWITGNYSINEVFTKFKNVATSDSAMYDRLKSRFKMFKTIHCEGTDRRGNNGKTT